MRWARAANARQRGGAIGDRRESLGMEQESEVPLEQMPNIPADVAGGVSETVVTDQNQLATLAPSHHTGQTVTGRSTHRLRS